MCFLFPYERNFVDQNTAHHRLRPIEIRFQRPVESDSIISHSVISVLIPIIVIYHYRQALKLIYSDTSIAHCRFIFAFAGALGS